MLLVGERHCHLVNLLIVLILDSRFYESGILVI